MAADGRRGYVLVATGAPGQGSVTVEVRRSLIGAAQGSVGDVLRELAPGDAVEVAMHAEPHVAAAVVSDLRAELAATVDINIVPTAGRRKHLLIADMDSTIIQQECIDEMADLFGLKAKISQITERAMRGELDFEAALTERLSLLAGLDEAGLEKVWRERIQLMPGAHTLIATMRAHGAYTALVSGGFTYFTRKVAGAVGFDTNRANQLEIADGRLTGRVLGPILGRAAKLSALTEFARLRGLPLADTLAVGDGANDLDMVRAAGLGVAYRAKPAVAAEAAASITLGDLTALLYLQGYAASDFVGGDGRNSSDGKENIRG